VTTTVPEGRPRRPREGLRAHPPASPANRLTREQAQDVYDELEQLITEEDSTGSLGRPRLSTWAQTRRSMHGSLVLDQVATSGTVNTSGRNWALRLMVSQLLGLGYFQVLPAHGL